MKKWASKRILLCPVCGKPYEYCHGKVVMPYFRHKDKTECEYLYSEPETQEHLKGKELLYKWILQQDGVTDVVLEGWIPETKQRPDIMFKYNNKQYVIEYQCTPIASEYLERHELYQAAGINDIWVLGTDKYIYKKEIKKIFRSKYIEKYVDYYFDSDYGLVLMGVDTINNIIKTKFRIKIIHYCDKNKRKEISEISSISNYNINKPLYIIPIKDMEFNNGKITLKNTIIKNLKIQKEKIDNQNVNITNNHRITEIDQHNKLCNKCDQILKNIILFFRNNYNLKIKNMSIRWGFKYNYNYYMLDLVDSYPYVDFYKIEYIDNNPVKNLAFREKVDDIESLIIDYIKNQFSNYINYYENLHKDVNKNS